MQGIVSLTTSTRREFINTAHMVASAVELHPTYPYVFKIIGGHGIKKSLCVDAFILALSHTSGAFTVPASNRMMFESYPSEASDYLVEGNIQIGGQKVTIGFTRNLMDQRFFMENSSGPSILIIPKGNNMSSDDAGDADLEIDLAPLKGGGAFDYVWGIFVRSPNQEMQETLARLDRIGKKRRSKLLVAARP